MIGRLPPWTFRVAFGVVAVLGIAWVVAGWMHSNAIRAEFLIARPVALDYPLTVQSNEAGRVVVDRSPDTEREGIWGLETEKAYAQISTIVRIDDATVERGVKPMEGELVPGDQARMDSDAYTGDPLDAHGIGFEELRTPSDIGPHPAWFIDGRRATWIVFVHGRGNDRLTESLRIIPSLVEQGFPILSITYRNDIGATPSPSGMRLWGLEEWRDLDAALSLAQRKGARNFAIVGSGFGASIVSTFLQESENISLVGGVIFDSPVLDLEGVARRWAADRGTPRIVAWLGRRLAAVRFGVDWDMLNQLERTEEFDMRILLMFGAQDPVTPPDVFTRFAGDLPDLVDIERFEQGGHTDLWNIDVERYESTVAEFLLDVVGSE
ncbi:MAG: alpha/beta fold hydrolase [Acidimicrobiia bacterium]|nr:MAG: alpha/beta fold hydrolase [Acidimicrobiia bacterium]